MTDEEYLIENKKYKHEQQSQDCIKWIDELPKYTQAPRQFRGDLGSERVGYCCIGAGCNLLFGFTGTSGGYDGEMYTDFKEAVGLFNGLGTFKHGHVVEIEQPSYKPAQKSNSLRSIHLPKSLSEVNDFTELGFTYIANMIKDNPYAILTSEVAKLVESHYSKIKKS